MGKEIQPTGELMFVPTHAKSQKQALQMEAHDWFWLENLDVLADTYRLRRKIQNERETNKRTD